MTMASESPPSGLKFESPTRIDLAAFSQSELYALSLCSSSAFDLLCTDDLVIPQTLPPSFNESAASRRQTYSRPPTSAAHRRRLPGLLPTPKPPQTPTPHDPERAENHSIINYVKHLIAGGDIENPPNSLPPAVVSGQETAADHPNGELGVQEMRIGRKRKRGRKPKVVENGGVKLEIVNGNGVVVDFRALGENGDYLFGEELRRRTMGLESEEEVLGFLRDLQGQWGSRRRKRKFVDAAELGDALPLGWKLLLGIRRREGRASVYCRRYISPTGQQFLSCKDASSYLQSYFRLDDENHPMEQSGNIHQVRTVASESHVGLNRKDDHGVQQILSNSILPSSLISDAHQKEINLLEIDNLAEVEIRDLFECYKCNVTFDEKNAYLQHLLSFHQRITRRYRLGSPVGYPGEERRKYNSHVGIHVKSSEESPTEIAGPKHIESSCQDELPQRISKMDALIEIAQSSILKTGSGPELEGDSSHKLNAVPRQETPAAHSENELSLESHPCDKEMEDHQTNRALNQEMDKDEKKSNMTSICRSTFEHAKTIEVVEHGNNALEIASPNRNIKPNHGFVIESVGHPVEEVVIQNMVRDNSEDPKPNEVEKCGNSELEICLSNRHNKPICDVVTKSVGPPVEEVILQNTVGDFSMPLTVTSEHPKPNEVEKHGNSELEIGFADRHIKQNHDVVTESLVHPVQEYIIHNMVADSSMPLTQALQFSAFTAISNEGADELYMGGQDHQNSMGFEDLRFDELDPVKFGFVNGQESLCPPEVSMELANDAGMERGFSSSVQCESEAGILSMTSRHQLTTICVWCRVEFNIEAFDSEPQSDSVGFMCPTCRAKISGQLNVLDGGLSTNSHLF